MQFPSRSSACRRDLNSHDAAEPRESGCPQVRARQLAVTESGQATLQQPCMGLAGAAAHRSYIAPQCHIEPVHCVGSSGVQSVCGAAASTTASCFGLWRRIEPAARHYRQRGAAPAWSTPQQAAGPLHAHAQRAPSTALPNPSLKRSANGMPPAPGRRYAVHFRQPGAGAIPSSPP